MTTLSIRHNRTLTNQQNVAGVGVTHMSARGPAHNDTSSKQIAIAAPRMLGWTSIALQEVRYSV